MHITQNIRTTFETPRSLLAKKVAANRSGVLFSLAGFNQRTVHVMSMIVVCTSQDSLQIINKHDNNNYHIYSALLAKQ